MPPVELDDADELEAEEELAIADELVEDAGEETLAPPAPPPPAEVVVELGALPPVEAVDAPPLPLVTLVLADVVDVESLDPPHAQNVALASGSARTTARTETDEARAERGRFEAAEDEFMKAPCWSVAGSTTHLEECVLRASSDIEGTRAALSK